MYSPRGCYVRRLFFDGLRRKSDKKTAGTNVRNEETTSTVSGDISFDAYVDRISELVTLNWPAMHNV